MLGAKNNCLIETVLLSTHNICFGREIRKLDFDYPLLTKGLEMKHKYSKTYVKRPLKNRQNKDLNDNWQLNDGKKYCRMLKWSF